MPVAFAAGSTHDHGSISACAWPAEKNAQDFGFPQVVDGTEDLIRPATDGR
jgi:hypothetical protein